MNQEDIKAINFDLPKNRSNVIKVIGVGGGGSNAINYMFQQGIKGVDFIITNTDAQALSESGVPTKIQLGATLTEGLGAGANPEVGARAAQESKDEIHSILSIQTKMVFITAGLGGGTGTGAAPIIAEMAKSLDILTVGIVTMPFQFEGRLRLEQAQNGLQRIKETVDALIVINNNKLREVYGNLGFKAGFAKADEVLATAARGIAEVITHHYTQNIDLKDAKTVLTNSGTAIMGSANSSGSNRAHDAIVKALDSPLLNDNKITGCKNVLLLIVSGSDEITIDEIGEINDYIQTEAGNHTNIIMGVGEDESLGNEVSVTVIATGFGQEQQNEISNTEAKKIIHTLEDEQEIIHDLSEQKNNYESSVITDKSFNDQTNISDQTASLNEDEIIPMNEILYNIEIEADLVFNGIDVEPETTKLDIKEDAPIFEGDITPQVQKEAEIKDELSLNEQHNSDEISEMSDEQFFKPQFDSVSEVSEADINKPFESEVELSEEEEFIFNEVTNPLFEIKVVEPEVVESESQILMDFELPLNQNENQEFKNVQDHLEEITPKKVPLENDFDNSSLDVEFELKTKIDENDNQKNNKDKGVLDPQEETNINPFEQTIGQTIASQSENRKAHLKAYNHKFSHQYQKIDEFEKEPAYKRKGLDLDENLPESPSRLSIENDSNDDLQIRSNNSFLHDNVD
ncbi:MAG: cell division protein FtsZ [Flavobacteriaceae bacterium]